jgi:hypothetical protein
MHLERVGGRFVAAHVIVVLRTTLRTTSGPNATRRKLNSHEYGTNQTPISKGVIRLSWKPFSARGRRADKNGAGIRQNHRDGRA